MDYLIEGMHGRTWIRIFFERSAGLPGLFMVFMLCVLWRAAAAPIQHHAHAWAEGLGDWVDSWIADWLAEMLVALMDGWLAGM